MVKFTTAVCLALAGSAQAFSTLKNGRTNQILKMSELSPEPMADMAEPVETIEEKAPTPVLPQMSESMPFMARPAVLTGSLPGDVGFDPFGFAKSESDLMNYREAEVKHARLAMLAAAGWPLSEVFDKKIAGALGMVPMLDANDRVPSLLNGGLGKISPLYWVGCIALAGAIDFYGIQRSKGGNADYFPGNLGFDPFGVYPKDSEGQRWMQLAEIKNGRLAMIAVFGFAIQEAVSKVGVVDETPFFFFPLIETMRQYTNSGYILHN
uniref:Plastid light harvesting protein n=1 Tax=Trieres chinensis TaxID=1514140 RepID=A0A7S1ZQD0_TRICV